MAKSRMKNKKKASRTFLPTVQKADPAKSDNANEDEKFDDVVVQELEKSKIEEGQDQGGEEHDWEDLTMSQDEIRSCEFCCFLETNLPEPMKRCAKCKWAYYCSRGCQKMDWGEHKLQCGGAKRPTYSEAPDPLSSYTAAMSASTGNKNLPTSLEDILATFSAGSGIPTSAFSSLPKPSQQSPVNNPWNDSLDHLPPHKAFSLIIDAYRLRVEDTYSFSGDAIGLYGRQDPLPDFRRFLNKAEKKGGILPSWWGTEKRKNCERQARNENEWSFIYNAVEKGDIQEHYKDSMMPMRLRMLAERVYGSNVMEF